VRSAFVISAGKNIPIGIFYKGYVLLVPRVIASSQPFSKGEGLSKSLSFGEGYRVRPKI
jgi:hypothetical protein